MPVQNSEIAALFNQMADLLDIEGANVFRIRAYRNAARTVSSLPQDAVDMIDSGKDLTSLPGIGRDLADKVREIIETGSFGQLRELEGKVPPELTRIMKVAGLGPKRVKALHQELGVTTLKELEEAARQQKVRNLEGFGEKTEARILEELAESAGKLETQRIKWMEAEPHARSLMKYLKASNSIKEIIVAGSYRRREETVGDLDILASVKKGSDVMDRFVGYEDVKRVISRGKTRSTIILRSGLQVDLRVLPPASYGAALHYFTGSKAHNIAVRKMGVQRGLKINEYGVFRDDKRIAGKTEEEVYKTVDLPYIEPELREDWGELEAARQGRLPSLISLDDLRGDLHTHTNQTDGHAGLEEMVRAAAERGYSYLAITDHSQRVTVARGLDARRLAQQIRAIDRLNGKLSGIVLLKGIEVDILKDGSLDLPDEILDELDLTVCSVHYNRKLPKEKMTERVLRAMDNARFNIFAHPTGRLLGERSSYEIDLERIMEGAKERGCLLEVNANPDRLDLSGKYCKMAKDMGLLLAISTDAHNPIDLDFIRYGIDQARRGWLEPGDVINTRSLKELKKILKR
jgi:DNA polymerase (family 10)